MNRIYADHFLSDINCRDSSFYTRIRHVHFRHVTFRQEESIEEEMQSALNWLQRKSTNGASNNALQTSKKHMETAKQLMREAHEDSPDLERIGESNVGPITSDRFSAPKSEEVCSTLVNELAGKRFGRASR